jgi:NAD(P)H dehydrogenase (quinone)
MVSNYVNAYENTGNVLANNMADGKMAFISRDDCALAAACAAMSDWEDRVVDVNGAELLTIGEYIAIANEVTGHNVKYVPISDEEQYEFFDSIGVPRTTEDMWAQTATNFPFCSDGMVTFGRALRLGQMATFTDDFEKLTGQKPLTVRQIFEDLENHLVGQRTSTEK